MAEAEPGRVRLSGPERQLAVLGSPIAHSKSPALHAAAYAVLGLPWSYGATEVQEDGLASFVGSLDESWRGLSLTMPLKRAVLPLLGTMDRYAELTAAANTVLLSDGARHGFNTDVSGVTEALRSSLRTIPRRARVLGGGATATSVLVALAELGCVAVAVAVRDSSRLGAVVSLCEDLDLELSVETLGASDPRFDAGLVVSTLPNGIDLGAVPRWMTGVPLFDVAYDPWPSALAKRWLDAGSEVVPGIDMLRWQALYQVRIFVGGSPALELPNEAAVRQAMWAAA